MDRLISEKEVLKAIENAMIFADWRDNKYDGWRSQNVVAWMPLPKSYKGEYDG